LPLRPRLPPISQKHPKRPPHLLRHRHRKLPWRSQSSGFEPLKTGFRAKNAKNAKKLLQGELVEFVYESLDVTLGELKRAINHRCSDTIFILPSNLCVLCVLGAS
jgi:hypothetical protein